ncbi:substrate-binding periplasmic protein [Thalassotalea euphylliae]|uniref:substrate-binding periplasmic protein n=1 Tax=Thalassotalea euphylliae TaxID=1655234 RepID=UPI0036427E70
MRILVTALLLFQSFSISANNQSFLLAGWELWYPYQYHDENKQLVGLDIESFELIANQAGFEYSLTELPWKRHLNMIKAGQMDIAMGASISDERREYAYFTLPYRKEIVNLVVLKGATERIKLKTLSDLIDSPYFIGVEGGYYYGKNYEKLITDSAFRDHISEVIDLEENVTMLLKGHLDGFLVDPITLNSFVHKYKLQGKFEIHPLEIYEDDIFIMLSKKTRSQQDVDRFNNAIKTLKENGKLKKIVEKWQLER